MSHPAEEAKEKKDPLTFGIEIEFALATIKEGKQDPNPEDPRKYSMTKGMEFQSADAWNAVRKHIADTLTKSNYAAYQVDIHNFFGTDPKKYKITQDSSVKPPSTGYHEDYEWYSIEINSPVYEFRLENLNTVREVVVLLHETYRMDINESCGLHVHVGDHTNGFNLQTLKNLISTIWTFEDLIAEIHPPHRVVAEHEHCPPLESGSYLGRFHRDKSRAQKRADGLENILVAQSVNELTDLMRSYKCSVYPTVRVAYDIQNLRTPYADDLKRTIEYRQHESTLNPDEMYHWVGFCVGLVQFAQWADPTELASNLRRYVSTNLECCTLTEVLKNTLHNPVAGIYYGIKIEEKKRRHIATEQTQDVNNGEGSSETIVAESTPINRNLLIKIDEECLAESNSGDNHFE